MGFQISLCQFHKNSLSERLLEGKDVTLWDELTEHRAVFQKASFQFWTRTALAKGFLRWKIYSVRWSNRTPSSFSESFFPVLNGRYLLFTIALHGLAKITLQIPHEQTLRKASWRECCNSVRWVNRTQSSFSESLFPLFKVRYFLFHHRSL